MTPLNFDQITYNEILFAIEQDWKRKLEPHERDLVILSCRYTKTLQEVVEIDKKVLQQSY
jgi:hypothetical protein